MHLYDNGYNMLRSIQYGMRTLSVAYRSAYGAFHQVNGETFNNDPMNANTFDQAPVEVGPNRIPVDYVTTWFYNAMPPGTQSTSALPEDPRPAPTDVSNYKNKGW